MNTIYLIRHGMTQANEQRRYCGSSDLPLSETGVQALQRIKYQIAPDRFMTSGMLRTEQTLEILFENVPHHHDRRFREVDFGDFELRSYEELKEDPAYLLWITGDNERNIPPNGESGAQMKERVIDAFRDLSEWEGKTALITHGGVIAAIMAHLFPREEKNRYQWQPKPGEGYELTWAGCSWEYKMIP